jgi:phage terminase large subunit-like protein
VKLTAEIIEGFAGAYLSQRYDQAQPTPDFHRECWARYCSPHIACATAAPRNHAKSTALTHDFGLASVCFRADDYIILVGSTEELAIEHLGDIRNELAENEALRRDFKIKGFVTDAKTDIIVECEDGHQFRIIARGAEQKIRGRKWRGKRPSLVLGDDLEDDEQVENKDRRRKFRRWFFRACKQALRDGGRIRVHGTILHVDSLLAHLMKNKAWKSKRYRAHKSFNDFSEILWPEKFPEQRLRDIRQEFISEGDAPGYSQEYLNDPMDSDEVFLRKEDFLAMQEEDYDTFKRYGCGVDFAVSKEDTANRTSFTVGGKDIRNLILVTDQRVGRLNTNQIIDEFFSVASRWGSDIIFYPEDGVIWKAIFPVLAKEMQTRDIWLAIEPQPAVKDKKTRGQALRKRHRAGGMRFDKRADWYEEYEAELLLFTGDSEAPADDQFDSTVHLVRGMDTAPDVEEEDALSEEELAFIKEGERIMNDSGRSMVTGY